MNATDLLAELRPPLDASPADERVLERILRAAPEPPRRSRYRRPLAVAAATAIAATAAVALLPSGGGLERAVAALSEPGVLLHFKVTTTHRPSGDTESLEAWQTPDGRRLRILRPNGHEFAYDQRRKRVAIYVPEQDRVIVDRVPDEGADLFGSIASHNPMLAGDLAALLRRALSGDDPRIRHVGRTKVRGIDVDHIRTVRRVEVRPRKRVPIVRDIYVRHDNALPVRVVEHLKALGNPDHTKAVSEFTGATMTELDASSERALELSRGR